ncbi:MAG: diacylglycerol kinase family protein [Rubrivivax sp.]
MPFTDGPLVRDDGLRSQPEEGGDLFVVFNLGSGADDAATARQAIESACAQAGRKLHLFEVEHADALGQTAGQAVQLARAVHGVVVAAGGDGTLNAVAQAVLGSGVRYGVLPQGTFNYFSRTHGIPSDVDQAMQVLLHEAAQPAQVGLVNERPFLVNASVGLYPQLLQDREGWHQRFGRRRVVAVLAALGTLLRGYRSLRLEVEFEGRVRKVRTPTLFVGNNALQMEQMGLGLAQDIDAGRLAGIMLRPVRRLEILWLMGRGAFGGLGDADELVCLPFAKLTIRAARRFGRRRIKVAVDGEIVWMPLPLTFSVSPQPLMLIRPSGPAPERQTP